MGCSTSEDLQPSESVSGGQSRHSTVPKMAVSFHAKATKPQFRHYMNATVKLIEQLEEAEL